MKENKYVERASYSWSKDSIRIINTPSNIAKKTYFYMQEVGYFKTQDSYFTERKNLDSFLVIYTISGCGKLRYEENDYELCSGQCFFIDCQKYHYYWTEKGKKWEFLWIHFNGTNVMGYYKQFLESGFHILNMKGKNIGDNIEEIIRLNQKRNLTTDILTSNLIHNILTEVLIQNYTNNMGTVYLPDYIKKIVRQIERRFREPLRLDDFQKECHRTKYYIAKEFKKYMGVSVNEYIILTRISYAKELLKYSEFSINEITYEIGMNNVTHFINLFKAREMKTPLAYRKEWKSSFVFRDNLKK